MSKPNLALNIVLVILGLLILALMVGLTGCGRSQNREYERPRCHFHCPCEDYDYEVVSPPALKAVPIDPSATPTPTSEPWYRRGNRVYVPVPVYPSGVVPFEQSSIGDFDAEVITAYTTYDIPIQAK